MNLATHRTFGIATAGTSELEDMGAASPPFFA